MHNDTKQIVTLKTTYKRSMKRNSTAMEKAGFKARIDELQNKVLNIEEVVTDAHLGIEVCYVFHITVYKRSVPQPDIASKL